ncbi:hypothetical protein MM440_02930 [Arsenicicoccus piscis]|uniref:ABC transporter membrane-spanning protein n=1 Tax=Arsenicicoccus piscis TaxID=673954 RepID=A0ABQ6HSV0_9MICO|nr:hypothetical protein [Arsenicicoccus piscis]MCH8626763.1 hypothetical protein [Arsenicicoccus piscis]GMA21447.1 ABC transporter membrane-spanning protein [Arsenicicoccus piscis]
MGLLVRLELRRSRWFWLVWIACLWLILPATVSKYEVLMPDPVSARATAASLEHNVTMRAMLGPPFDLLRAGPFTMWRVGTFVAAAAAMMAALGLIRATRAEEEEGRTELLRSGAIGRHAPLAAGLLVSTLGTLVLGLLIAASMAKAAPPASGALAVGLGIALTGLVFVGVAAVAVQLTESARAARFIAMSVLGGAYLVRAVADGSPADSPLVALQWVSPLEWAALTRPYVDERWWVLLLPLALSLLLIGLAVALENRRDLGAGLRPAGLGPATAAPGLRGAWSLAARLDRGAVIGWTVAVVICGIAFGSLGNGMDQMLAANPQLADMMRKMGGGVQQLKDAFYVALVGIMATVLAMLALQLWSRLRHEEQTGGAEALLATGTSRLRLAASHLVPALVVPTVLLALTGALMALPAAMANGDPGFVATVTGGALALAPGIWLVVGIVVLVHGWAGRSRAVAWIGPAVVGWTTFVVWIGPLLDLPGWLQNLQLFGHLPHLPGAPMTWTAVVVQTLVAAALIVVGLVGYRRRDLTVP